MISDSPPDRELEWTDEGIQSSKNLINRIDRYFRVKKTNISEETIRSIEIFVNNIEINIKNFSLNKCVADIYTLFNFLEKNKMFLNNHDLSKKILISLFPIIPSLSSKIYQVLFSRNLQLERWPTIDQKLLKKELIDLPIQINGKFIQTLSTKIDYELDDVISDIKKIDKIKLRIENITIKKIINVQNKIINLIIS